MYVVIELRVVNGHRESRRVEREITPAQAYIIDRVGSSYLAHVADGLVELCQNQIERPEEVHRD